MTAAEILKVFDLTAEDGQMIAIGTVVFFIFWQVVASLIVKPFLALYEEREALTFGAAESSKHIHDEAAAINAKSDEQVQSARVAAMEEKIQSLTAAKMEAARIAESTETQVQEMVRKARWEREQNVGQTRQKVMSDAETLARDVVSKLTLSFAIILLVASSASAESAGHGGGHEGSPSDLIPYWINFATYIALMFLCFRKLIANGWVARKDQIATLVNKGKIERAAAEDALRAAKAKQATIQSQVQDLLTQIKREGVAEVQEILQDAKARAERARVQGEEMLAAEQKAFETALKRELAEAVVTKATEMLKGKVNADTDAGLRAKAVGNIGELVH